MRIAPSLLAPRYEISQSGLYGAEAVPAARIDYLSIASTAPRTR